MIVSILPLVWFVFEAAGARSSVYWSDVRNDYEYRFPNAAIHSSAHIADGRLSLPAVDRDVSAAHLRVHIRSSLLGRFFEPRLQLGSGPEALVHYFERGARGVRYLDVTRLAQGGVTDFPIAIERARMRKGEQPLVGFTSDPYDDATFLIVSPHPDDAEIAAYGLYSNADDVYIATITAGNAGRMTYAELIPDRDQHYRTKGTVRVLDSITTPWLGGVLPERTVNLGYFDARLADMYHSPTSPILPHDGQLSDFRFFRSLNVSPLIKDEHLQPNWESLVEDIVLLLSAIEPDIVVTPYPVLDTHADHKFATVALFEALARLPDIVDRVWLYTNHHPASEAYPFGRRGSVMALPPNNDPDVPVGTSISIQLTRDDQIAKIIALESMSDLRLDTEWTTLPGLIRIARDAALVELKGRNVSYFRRAAKSNELFYEFKVDELMEDAPLRAAIVGDIPEPSNVRGSTYDTD